MSSDNMKFYRVKPYQVYLEFYEDTNIVKRRFIEGETFFATPEQLNSNQLDRLEEIKDYKKGEKVKKEKVVRESQGDLNDDKPNPDDSAKAAARAKLLNEASGIGAGAGSGEASGAGDTGADELQSNELNELNESAENSNPDELNESGDTEPETF